MARNGTAVNVITVFLLLGGLLAATRLSQEVIPDASLDRVRILVPYPGATPSEGGGGSHPHFPGERGAPPGARDHDPPERDPGSRPR